MVKSNIFSKSYTTLSITFLTVFIGMVLVGCSNGDSSERALSTSKSSRNELMPYLGMAMEDANNQLEDNDFASSFNSSVYETNDYRIIYLNTSNNNSDYMAIMDSQEGKYIDHIAIYDNDESLSIMGIHVGMTANEALEILRENKYSFYAIYDSSSEEKGDYQQVFYKRNGVYQIGLEIYGGGETNPYGSLDESDIHTDGTVGYVSTTCIITDRFSELVNRVGDRIGGAGDYIAESINDECAELTMFVENDSFNVRGIHVYGTYVFGENVITVDLQPGAGDCPYITRVSISDICPYKLCGIYYNMDKESALSHMSDLGITARNGEGDSVVYDIDSYTTLEVHFDNNYVCFIECIDDYPEKHEKRYIE